MDSAHLRPRAGFLRTFIGPALGLLALAMPTPASAVEYTRDATGNEIARDYSTISLRFSLTAKKSKFRTQDSVPTADDLRRQLDVVLPGESDPVQLDPAVPGDDREYDRQQIRSDVVSGQALSSDKFKFTFAITIKENPGATARTRTIKSLAEGNGNKIIVALIFHPMSVDGKLDTSSQDRENLEVSLAPFLDGAPEDIAFEDINRGFKVKWNANKDVQVLGEERTTKAGGMVAFVFNLEEASNSLTLKGTTVAADGTTSEATCSFSTFTEETGSCVPTCVNSANEEVTNTTVLNGQQDDHAALKVAQSANTGSMSVSGLQSEIPYAILLQYSGSVKRSTCYRKEFLAYYNLAELHGAETQEGAPCFVATAAYGSPLSKHLEIFRWLRWRVLLKSDLGKELVRQYYRLSPPLAETITQSPILQTATKMVLWPLAVLLHFLRLLVDTPTLAILTTLAASLILLLRHRRKILP